MSVCVCTPTANERHTKTETRNKSRKARPKASDTRRRHEIWLRTPALMERTGWRPLPPIAALTGMRSLL